jgi:hypothetical protein
MEAMGKSAHRELDFDIRPVVKSMGLDKVIRQIGEEELLHKLLGQSDVDKILANMTPAKRQQLWDKLDMDEILANMRPAKRQQLLRRLTAEAGKISK